MKIKDTCICGALFNVEGANYRDELGEAETAGDRHDKWLASHEVCRTQNAKMIREFFQDGET